MSHVLATICLLLVATGCVRAATPPPRQETARDLHFASIVVDTHVDTTQRLLGSDFDGGNMPYGMEDAAGLPPLTPALLDRGHAPDDVRKILGGSALRVLEQVGRVARSWRESS